MSNEELLRLAEEGYITKVGEYAAARAGLAGSASSVEDAAVKKAFVDATSYSAIKDQMDTDFIVKALAVAHCKYEVKVGKAAKKTVDSFEEKVDKGVKVTVKALPQDNYTFDGWEGETVTTESREFTNQSATIKAKVKEPVTLQSITLSLSLKENMPKAGGNSADYIKETVWGHYSDLSSKVLTEGYTMTYDPATIGENATGQEQIHMVNGTAEYPGMEPAGWSCEVIQNAE